MELFEGLSDDDLLEWLAPALAGACDDMQGPGTQGHATLTGQPMQHPPMPWSGVLKECSSVAEPTTQGPGHTGHTPSKPRRKRGPTSQAQVAALQRQLAEQTAALQNLSIQNLRLNTRLLILETVLAVKDAQVARGQAIRDGLKFDPCEGIGTTSEALMQATPAWTANKFLELSNSMAVRLAPLLVHLQRCPYLLYGPEPHSRWPSPTTTHPHGCTLPQLWRAQSPPSQAKGASSPGDLDTVITDLQFVSAAVNGMQIAFQHDFWIKPQMVLASSLHVHSIDAALHDQWEELMSTVRAAHARACEAGLEGSAPPIAPDAHWKGVARSLMLSDTQRLQASCLLDLITNATAGVVAQRAKLGAAMAQLQQQQQQQQQVKAEPSQNSGSSTQRSASGISSGSSSGVVVEGQLAAAAWKVPEVIMQEASIVKKLQLTLVKQGCLVILAAEVLFFCILSPIQMAMALVGSYPYLPDDMAILHAVAQEFTPQVLNRLSSCEPAAPCKAENCSV